MDGTGKQGFDVRQIRQWWDLERTAPDGSGMVTEIRILGESKKTYSGYFDNIETLIKAIEPHYNANIYYTMNVLDSALLEREQGNKIVFRPAITTSAKDIIGRQMIVLDIDPIRPSSVNSTEEELGYAKQMANEIILFLRQQGFYPPITAISSSGVHIKIGCALANNEENTKLVKTFLEAMSMMFSNEKCHVDTVLYDPNRIIRLQGSCSRKGNANSKTRPQRHSYYVKVPSEYKVNDIEYFRKVANLLPKPEKPDKYNNYQSSKFDLQEFINKHNINVSKTIHSNGVTKYILAECPFNSSHKAPDSAIFELSNGAISFVCFHSSCSGYGWREFRSHFDPEAYSYKPSTYQGYQKPINYTPPKKENIVEVEEKGKVWLKMSDIDIEEIDPANYIPSGLEQIDSQLIGFKRGHVSVWSGLRGSSKSTMFNVLILNAAQRGYKSALWTGELDGGEEKTWLFSQASGKHHNKPSKFNNFYYTPKPIQEKIEKWIDKYFVLFNNEYGDNYQQVEKEIRKLHSDFGVDVVILDNLMTLDIEDILGTINEKQKNFMKMLTKLAKDLKIHVHIACHPNKSMGFLRPNSISGSGHIPDLAQNVFILHRKGLDFQRDAKDFLDQYTINDIEDSRATNLMEICKCRAQGSAVGMFIKMHYEQESRRLKNDISEHIVYNWEEVGVQEEIQFDKAEFDNFDFDDYGDLPD